MAAAARDPAVTLTARLVLAHELDIASLKQATELDFLLTTDASKAAVRDAIGTGPPQGKAVRAFRAVFRLLATEGGAGTRRLTAASDSEIGNLVLSFKSRFATSVPETAWRWTLRLSTSADTELRGAVADAAAEGGKAGILIRRPRVQLGPLARELEELVAPERAQAREAKGGGKKGGKKGGKNKGKGRGGVTPPTMVPPAVPKAGDNGGGEMRGTYTGREAENSAAKRTPFPPAELAEGETPGTGSR
jgi:hypothetical protein